MHKKITRNGWKIGCKLAEKMLQDDICLIFHTNSFNRDTFTFCNKDGILESQQIMEYHNGNGFDIMQYTYNYRFFMSVVHRGYSTIILKVDPVKYEKYKRLFNAKNK